MGKKHFEVNLSIHALSGLKDAEGNLRVCYKRGNKRSGNTDYKPESGGKISFDYKDTIHGNTLAETKTGFKKKPLILSVEVEGQKKKLGAVTIDLADYCKADATHSEDFSEEIDLANGLKVTLTFSINTVDQSTLVTEEDSSSTEDKGKEVTDEAATEETNGTEEVKEEEEAIVDEENKTDEEKAEEEKAEETEAEAVEAEAEAVEAEAEAVEAEANVEQPNDEVANEEPSDEVAYTEEEKTTDEVADESTSDEVAEATASTDVTGDNTEKTEDGGIAGKLKKKGDKALGKGWKERFFREVGDKLMYYSCTT